jgi:transposase
VIVANPRQIPLISQNIKKSDQTDPELLARMARSDPKLLNPIVHRAAETQSHLSALRTRDVLVSSRTKLINHVRGAVKSLGARLAGCNADNFHATALKQIPKEIVNSLKPVLGIIGELNRTIRRFDKEMEKVCEKKYPETDRLRQIKGVGPITALAFVLILEDPARFKNRRAVGAYLGLTPKKQSSGSQDPQLRISKAGDTLLRRLLICCANYIMGPKGEDCDLRRHGEKIAQRGGKNAKKRAVVAVARKLSILLHCLWCSGEKYEPLRNCKK